MGAVTNKPAASRKLHPFGTGSSDTSFAVVLVANAPWVAPKTRDPTENLGLLELEGVAKTMPANSAPDTHGNAVCRVSGVMRPSYKLGTYVAGVGISPGSGGCRKSLRQQRGLG